MGVDVQATLAKYLKNAGAAGSSYAAGVKSVTESPMAKAAARADQYVQGVMQSVADGTYQAGLRAVTLQEWQDKSAGIGQRRYTEGIKEAAPKMADFLSQFLPFAESVSKEIDRMPKGTDADADARMLAAVAKLRQFRYTRRG